MKKSRQMPRFIGEAEKAFLQKNKLMEQENPMEIEMEGFEQLEGEMEEDGETGVRSANEYIKEDRACLCQKIEALGKEVEHYRGLVIDRCMKDDLSAIKAIDPNVEGLDSLGGEYIELIRAGVAAPIAYHAIHAARKGKNPPSMGDIRAGANSDEVPISYAQAMSMSPSQMEGNYERLRRSMRDWK